jgi:hypothetical protein
MYYNYLFLISAFMFFMIKFFSVDTIIYSRYNRYKTIIKFVPKKQVFNIAKLFVGVIVTTMYYNMLNFLFNNVKKIKFNTYVVTYTINGKLYKFIAKPTRGPSRVVQISNEMQIDVTDEILPYMGPNYDWYGIKLYPTFFNYTTLVFEFSNGLEYVCKGHECLLDSVQYMNKKNID